MNKYIRQSVTPLIIGTAFLRIGASSVTVMLALLLAHLSNHTGHAITSIDVGLLAVAFYITELVLAPLMGALSDQWGRRRFLVLGPALGFIEVTLLPFTPNTSPLLYLLILQVIAGLSSAIFVPATLSYLADFTAQNRGRRMRVMSFYELATSGGLAIGVVLGGFAWERLGRYAFLLVGLFYLVVLVSMLLTPDVRQLIEHASLRRKLQRYGRLLRVPRLVAFVPAWLCVCALLGVWLTSLLPFLLSMPHHDTHQLLIGSMTGHGSRLSLVLGGLVLVFGLSLLFWAFFLNRIKRLTLMLMAVMGIFLVCIALTGINHRGEGNNIMILAWMPLLLAGIFAISGFAPAALAYLADISEESAKDRGMLMGLYSIFLGLGQLLGNGMGGVFAHQWGFDGLIYFSLLLGCIAFLSIGWLVWQERKLSLGKRYAA